MSTLGIKGFDDQKLSLLKSRDPVLQHSTVGPKPKQSPLNLGKRIEEVVRFKIHKNSVLDIHYPHFREVTVCLKVLI